MPTFLTLNLNRPCKFVKLTTLEVRIQTFQILTQRCSCALNRCSGAVQYLLNCMQVHSVAFRGCSTLTQRHSRALNSIQRVFNTHSQVFMCTQSHSGLFNACTNAIFLMVTPQWVAFNNDWMMVMHTHWVFTLIQWWSCILIGCSGAVQYSLIGIHVHWMTVQGVFNTHSLAFTCTHKCSGGVQYSLTGIQPVQIGEGPIDMLQICEAH